MKERICRLKEHEHYGFRREFIEELEGILMSFADSIAKLQADVAKLIAQNGAGDTAAAVAAAVAAKDASDAAAVDAVDASVAAALTPAAPAA
jgi:hypothetical protein